MAVAMGAHRSVEQLTRRLDRLARGQDCHAWHDVFARWSSSDAPTPSRPIHLAAIHAYAIENAAIYLLLGNDARTAQALHRQPLLGKFHRSLRVRCISCQPYPHPSSAA